MKRLLEVTLLSSLLGLSTLSAQVVSDECKKEASLGIESAKNGNYEEAAPYLLNVRKNCPQYSVSTYQYSAKMLREKLKHVNKDDKAQKKALASELIALLKERKQYFPEKTKKGFYYSSIAQLMFDGGIGTKEDQYKQYKLAFEDKKNIKNPKVYYYYFLLITKLQKEGKKEIQEVFDLYDEISGEIEVKEIETASKISKLTQKEESGATLLNKEKKILARSEVNLKAYSGINAAINKKLGKLADCPNLIPLFTGQFEANKNNITWVKSAARRMYKKECTSDPLFLKLVEKQHQLEPSAASAKYLGKLSEQRGDNVAALKYYNESADLETNPSDKADVYVNIARNFKKKGQFGQARKFYRKALKFKPSLGQAYVQIANMIAKSANNCGADEFNKRAVYWLAIKYIRKAVRVSPSLKGYSKKAIANFKGRAPSKTDVFQKGMQGKIINIGCWIGESVKVPNL